MDTDVIYNEDCVKGMKRIPDKSIDMVLTDPPYLIAYKSGHRKNKLHRFCKEIPNDQNNEFRQNMISEYLKECFRVLKDDTAAYVFGSPKTLYLFRRFAVEAGFVVKNVIVWVKNNTTAGDLQSQFAQKYENILYLNKGRCKINGKRISDVWEFPRVPAQHLLHQNQKPLALLEQCIVKSCKSGGVILDGFMGSGTTAIACMRTGCRYVGFEIDKGYYEIAMKRIEEYKD